VASPKMASQPHNSLQYPCLIAHTIALGATAHSVRQYPCSILILRSNVLAVHENDSSTCTCSLAVTDIIHKQSAQDERHHHTPKSQNACVELKAGGIRRGCSGRRGADRRRPGRALCALRPAAPCRHPPSVAFVSIALGRPEFSAAPARRGQAGRRLAWVAWRPWWTRSPEPGRGLTCCRAPVREASKILQTWFLQAV